MQQQPMQMHPRMASYYQNSVTSDHIQQYLDENKSLILKIVEGQNSGKLSECAESQAKLQRNLMYLAAIADSQPQQPSIYSQYPSSGMVFMQQHHQGQVMSTLSHMAAPGSSFPYAQQSPFSALQQPQYQYQHHQHHAALNGQLISMSSGGSSGCLSILHGENSHLGINSFTGFGRGEGGSLAGGGKLETGNFSSADQGRGGSSTDGHGEETLHEIHQ
ncbi:hypothetical protein SAY87_002833 [Trapa incisa]|uniref:SS18 N-terminal domain-containing protein n=1 Tax=Trapa incisa TaxID=236973 RepID=A0AAN7PVW6_9MYRT|nr:hypothetical protein SAY87_002833 [Trapa incisa]